MTEMQEFVLDLVKKNPKGVSGSYVGARWREHKGQWPHVASRRAFGATSAAYRTLRFLEANARVRCHRTKSSGGFTIETYHPL